MCAKKVCFDAISHNSPVALHDCHGMKGNQLWRYRKVRELRTEREFTEEECDRDSAPDKTLFHPVSNSCVDTNASERRVFANTCDAWSPSQQWLFERTNGTVLENFNRASI
ncbi:polypeptide N-acetylgalactosaminyltransferase 10-like [Solea solea]|uniref:polypeptide N-acetylgalactosaminyltransferase 10-like n=1 Tax=Solea solea TaxID=90069 RepID=UPI00272B8C4F|nr:polypeptide N-acetylgalactosaminyltransferase 10-like [Solea solea]